MVPWLRRDRRDRRIADAAATQGMSAGFGSIGDVVHHVRRLWNSGRAVFLSVFLRIAETVRCNYAYRDEAARILTLIRSGLCIVMMVSTILCLNVTDTAYTQPIPKCQILGSKYSC